MVQRRKMSEDIIFRNRSHASPREIETINQFGLSLTGAGRRFNVNSWFHQLSGTQHASVGFVCNQLQDFGLCAVRLQQRQPAISGSAGITHFQHATRQQNR
jgi:hypothetical protein